MIATGVRNRVSTQESFEVHESNLRYPTTVCWRPCIWLSLVIYGKSRADPAPLHDLNVCTQLPLYNLRYLEPRGAAERRSVSVSLIH